MKPDSRILYCDCAYAAALPPDVKREVRQALRESGLSFEAVPDLCELAARKAPLLMELAGASTVTIAACHPRAVKWLFAAGGAPLRNEGVEYLDMREIPAEQLLASIRELARGERTESGKSDSITTTEDAAAETPAWKPWFPVIDYSRCQNCQQCLGFCLFGVYGLDADGKVHVANPASCKTGCPACARVCPDAAIVFPKYLNAPINGGEAKESDAAAEPVKLDKAALLNGDLMQVLRDRGKGGPRFAADPAQLRAAQERLAHLAAPQRPPDITLDALAAKPPSTEPA